MGFKLLFPAVANVEKISFHTISFNYLSLHEYLENSGLKGKVFDRIN